MVTLYHLLLIIYALPFIVNDGHALPFAVDDGHALPFAVDDSRFTEIFVFI